MDAAISPPALSIEEEQEELISEFAFFDDWMERYEYLIDLGRKLPEFPEEYKIDDFKLRGCQSQVWLMSKLAGDRLVFQAISDAAIVSGLVAIILRIYSNRTPQEIIDTEPDFISQIGLDEHLSPTRKNGLSSMLKAVKGRAQLVLDEA